MIRIGTVVLVAVAAISVSACASLKGRASDPATVAPPPAAPGTTAPQPVAPKPVAAAPLPRSCVPRALPPAPRYPDSDAALRDAAGAADRYQLMAAGRLLRQKRLDELERVVAGCR